MKIITKHFTVLGCQFNAQQNEDKKEEYFFMSQQLHMYLFINTNITFTGLIFDLEAYQTFITWVDNTINIFIITT